MPKSTPLSHHVHESDILFESILMLMNHTTNMIAARIPAEAPYCHRNTGDAYHGNEGENKGHVVCNGLMMHWH